MRFASGQSPARSESPRPHLQPPQICGRDVQQLEGHAVLVLKAGGYFTVKTLGSPFDFPYRTTDHLHLLLPTGLQIESVPAPVHSGSAYLYFNRTHHPSKSVYVDTA